MTPRTFYSNGKLLLTGEYVVLDSALSLALPVRYGQYLTVTKIETPQLIWKSFDEKGAVWFETVFHLQPLQNQIGTPPAQACVAATSNTAVAETLLKILRAAKQQNPAFLEGDGGFEVHTQLTFPREWGLGSSATLLNNLAQWAGADAYRLLWDSFPGSGYDIACAQQRQPLLYRLIGQTPEVTPVTFRPPFAEKLYFVHRNQKTRSDEAIRRYRSAGGAKEAVVAAISHITQKMATAAHLRAWEAGMQAHERLLSELLHLPPVKEELFGDYFGSVKSLGAWGGDFILATGNEETPAYFRDKGFPTVIPYLEMA